MSKNLEEIRRLAGERKCQAQKITTAETLTWKWTWCGQGIEGGQCG